MRRKCGNVIQKQDYSIFLKCSELETIPYWKDFFENCAVGIFPNGINFKEHTMYYRKGKSQAPTILYISYEAEEALQTVKDFVRKEIGISSIDEIREKKIKVNEALKNNIITDELIWKSIRSRITKERMLDAFVRKVQSRLKLSDNDAKQLKCVINLGIITDIITSDDIKIENAEIHEIDGISKNENGFYVDRKTEPCNSYIASYTPPLKQTVILKDWDKTITQYDNFVKTK
tara:strand:- start:6530 stop:7225 length:696 start_codon:yes stop_codon:yes gene_type:complete